MWQSDVKEIISDDLFWDILSYVIKATEPFQEINVYSLTMSFVQM